MKSIKEKLIVFVGLLVTIICIAFGTASFMSSSKALTSNLGKTLPKIAEQTASNIQGRIEGQLNSLEVIAARDDIKNPDNSWENKKKILLEEVKRNGYIKIGIADKNGDIKYSDGIKSSVKERENFKKALSGRNYVSDPTVSKSDKYVVVAYAVPIKYNNKVVGVLMALSNGNKLSELTNQVKFGATGMAFMIRKDGTTIAHPSKNLVLKMDNSIINAKKNSKLQQLADIEKKMINGETGMAQYYYDGIYKYLGYAPVKGTEWSVGVIVSKSEMQKAIYAKKLMLSTYNQKMKLDI